MRQARTVFRSSMADQRDRRTEKVFREEESLVNGKRYSRMDRNENSPLWKMISCFS
jgi:hypothetical protein